MQTIIEAMNIVKRYGKLTAVDHVDLTIAEGVCFGLLGPNGAGKTTLIEIMEDIIDPTEGEVLYKGKPRTPSFREEVGIMFQQTALLSYLTVLETLHTFHKLYHHAADIRQIIDVCHLAEIKNQMSDKISGGQRQRLLLALAMVNQPNLLFLDEPSTGLDPQARQNLWKIVADVKKNGQTIILTTHYMEEAQSLCDEIAIMDHGRIIARGSPRELIKNHSRGVTVIIPKQNFTAPLKTLPMAFHEAEDRVEIHTDQVTDCLGQLMELGIDLTDIAVQSPNLEQVFLNLTGRRLRD